MLCQSSRVPFYSSLQQRSASGLVHRRSHLVGVIVSVRHRLAGGNVGLGDLIAGGVAGVVPGAVGKELVVRADDGAGIGLAAVGVVAPCSDNAMSIDFQHQCFFLMPL